jgi:hypothetical protein
MQESAKNKSVPFFQAIFLADASFAENIAFGVPAEQIDLERVRQSAQRAQIAEFIESSSEGYATMVFQSVVCACQAASVSALVSPGRFINRPRSWCLTKPPVRRIVKPKAPSYSPSKIWGVI